MMLTIYCCSSLCLTAKHWEIPIKYSIQWITTGVNYITMEVCTPVFSGDGAYEVNSQENPGG